MTETQKGPKICVICGKPIPEGGKRYKYCSDKCYKEGHRRRNLKPSRSHPYLLRRNKICIDCGKEFVGGILSLRCESCERNAAIQRSKEYRQRKKAGNAREIGSTDICINCGKRYIVNGSLQRYCPECSREHQLEHWRAATSAWREINMKDPEKRAARNARKRDKPPLENHCQVCGKDITGATKGTKYCSEICKRKAANERRRKKYKEKRESQNQQSKQMEKMLLTRSRKHDKMQTR